MLVLCLGDLIYLCLPWWVPGLRGKWIGSEVCHWLALNSSQVWGERAIAQCYAFPLLSEHLVQGPFLVGMLGHVSLPPCCAHVHICIPNTHTHTHTLVIMLFRQWHCSVPSTVFCVSQTWEISDGRIYFNSSKNCKKYNIEKRSIVMETHKLYISNKNKKTNKWIVLNVCLFCLAWDAWNIHQEVSQRPHKRTISG